MDNNYKRMLEDRLGMFVHYGAYSVLGGKYKGEEIFGLGEWIQRRAEIPIAEYDLIAKDLFRPKESFARELVSKAKAAGVRYIVLTSKHHDGFCLFNSKVDGHNTYNYFGRDICRELADECRAQGLEIGFYYSHTLDWHEKNAAGNYEVKRPDVEIRNRNYWDFPNDNIDFEQYFRDKCLPQVRELLTNYGPLKLIWFDYPHDITREQATELRALVKELQPDCLINSRIGYGLEDYNSLGDNSLPTCPLGVPTECLITLNHTWGYKSYDMDWKSTEDVVGVLCRTLAADSTLLMNVGPMGDGTLTPETDAILEGLGEWTRRNSEAVYGNVSGTPFKASFPWGYAAKTPNSLLLYIKGGEKNITLSGIESKPVALELLGGERTEFEYSDGTLSFALPEGAPAFSVYRVLFDEAPKYDASITVDSSRSSLPAVFSYVAKRSDLKKRAPILFEYSVYETTYGTYGLAANRIENTHQWKSSEDALLWEVNFAEAGDYEAELLCVPPSYETVCCSPDTEQPYSICLNGQKNSLKPGVKREFRISKTGDYNQRIVRDGGVFHIEKPGKYEVVIFKDNEEIGLGISELRLVKI